MFSSYLHARSGVHTMGRHFRLPLCVGVSHSHHATYQMVGREQPQCAEVDTLYQVTMLIILYF